MKTLRFLLPLSLFAALAAWSSASASAPPSTRPAATSAASLAPDSLYALQFVGDARISPDGRRIAYVVTRSDREKNRYDSDLWVVETSGGDPRPFVAAEGNDMRPRWSPDGRRLAFVSTRTGKPQIHVLEMSGGEAWRLTDECEGVGAFSWSPDGKRIAYLARRTPADPGGGAENAAADDEKCVERARDPAQPFVTERMFYRYDGEPGFTPEASRRLLVVEVATALPAPVGPLTSGRRDPSEPAWSADGQWLIFSALPDQGRRQEIEADTELYRVRADGSGAPEALTGRHGPDDGPVVAHGSGWIAWRGHDLDDPPKASASVNLYAMKADGSERRELTTRLDRNVGEAAGTDAASPHAAGAPVAFSADGRHLLFVAADRGRAELYQVPVRGGEVRSLSSGLRGDLREFSVAGNGAIAAVFGSPTQPYEVWLLDRPTAQWRRLTGHGAEALPAARFSPYEELAVDSFDGRRIQGWLIKPPGFVPERKYPLILYIHGGPHSMYGESFFHEFQVLANAGYLVLISNPRGSTGYGQDFANSVQYRYPGDDYRDLMAVLDEVVARGFVDEARMGVAGGSGGGVLTSWAVAKTDRFAAALVERPVVNWYSFVAASDRNAYFVRHWFRDYPWRDPEDYLARSPLSLVDRVNTPVLVIQGAEDYRTPVDQGLQYYTALRMLDKEARLALFPTMGHSQSRMGPPVQRVQRLEIILEWFAEKLLRRPAPGG